MKPPSIPFEPGMNTAMGPGESVVWTGAPQPRGPLSGAAALAVWAGVGVILFGVVGVKVLLRVKWEDLPQMAPFLGFCFLIGGGLIVGAVHQTWHRRRVARYLLTDRKVVLFPDGAGKRWIAVKPVLPHDLTTSPDGSHTRQIHFGSIPFEWASLAYAEFSMERIRHGEEVRGLIAETFRSAGATPPPLPPAISPDSLEHKTVFEIMQSVLAPEEAVLWIYRQAREAYVISDRRAYVVRIGASPIVDAYPPEHWGGFMAKPAANGLWNLDFSWWSFETPRRVYPSHAKGAPPTFENQSMRPVSMDGLRNPGEVVNLLIAVDLHQHRKLVT